MRPSSGEYSQQAAVYVALVTENDVMEVLEQQLERLTRWWASIPQSAAGSLQSPYTWTVQQVLQHITDAERIFGYRLLRIARGDQTPLPGFDENSYAVASLEGRLSLTEIVDEFSGLRQANIALLRSLPPDAWSRHGITSGTLTTVRALAFILAGHVRHHDNVLRRRLQADEASR
jgi:hypothetical protein